MNKEELKALYDRLYQPSIVETEDVVACRQLLFFVEQMRSRATAYPEVYSMLRGTCEEFGYALTIHGSQANDLDIVAIPWIEHANSSEELLKALRHDLGAHLHVDEYKHLDEPEAKPHGRLAWNLFSTKKKLGMPHSTIDLSVMPRLNK
jgi:hypothetical protein